MVWCGGTQGWSPLSAVLFTVFCRVYDPRSPPPSVFSSSVRDASPDPARFAPPREALSAQQKIRNLPTLLFFLSLSLSLRPFHLISRYSRLQEGGGGGDERACGGASGIKLRKRKEEPPQGELLPVMLLINGTVGGKGGKQFNIKYEIWGEGWWGGGREKRVVHKGALVLRGCF